MRSIIGMPSDDLAGVPFKGARAVTLFKKEEGL